MTQNDIYLIDYEQTRLKMPLKKKVYRPSNFLELKDCHIISQHVTLLAYTTW